MSLLGLGLDLVDLARFRRIIDQQGQRFLDRCFTAEEQRYCVGLRDPVPHLAARFAAKEAVSKAFGTGIGEEMAFLDIEVLRTPSGAPEIRLHGAAALTAQARDIKKVLVTLTHTDISAAAQAVVLG